MAGHLLVVLIQVETDELLEEDQLEFSSCSVRGDRRWALARGAELQLVTRRTGEIEGRGGRGGESGGGGGRRVLG